MRIIEHIHLEDGPEDGRVLAADLLRAVTSDMESHPQEISLFEETLPNGKHPKPHLLGRYLLRTIDGNLASYRWQPA